jgi:UPF0755 protein
VAKKLSTGKVITESITIPEGLRASKIAKIFEARFGIDPKQFMKLCNDSLFCHSIGISTSSLEGYLYPDTYRFNLNPTVEEIQKKMVIRFKEVFRDTLIQNMKKPGLSVHQVITLASIVEGEAVVDSERSIVAALYLNRLHLGMPLQADPTIQYLVQNGPRRLLTTDLRIDSPYNTYIYSGLPPGPVNNPGMASILAVIHPAPVGYLYMVANGDGSHTFSRTLVEHLRAKRRFDQIRRRVNQHK